MEAGNETYLTSDLILDVCDALLEIVKPSKYLSSEADLIKVHYRLDDIGERGELEEITFKEAVKKIRTIKGVYDEVNIGIGPYIIFINYDSVSVRHNPNYGINVDGSLQRLNLKFAPRFQEVMHLPLSCIYPYKLMGEARERFIENFKL